MISLLFGVPSPTVGPPEPQLSVYYYSNYNGMSKKCVSELYMSDQKAGKLWTGSKLEMTPRPLKSTWDFVGAELPPSMEKD